MPLKEAIVPVQFAGGVETKMDPKAVPTARLLDLQNGVFTRAISISKRNGYEALSDSVESSTDTLAAIRLASRGDELVAFTRTRAYSHEPETDQWSDVGAVFSIPATDRAAVRTGTAQTMPDFATLNGVSVYAWEDSLGGVYWTVEDATSDRVYRAPTQADALGQRPRCVACGNALHIYYAVPSLTRIYVIVVNTSTPAAAVTPTILVDDLRTSNPVYDACPTQRTGTPALMTWAQHGTTNIRVGYVDASGVLGSPATGHPSVCTTSAASMTAASPIACAHHWRDGDVEDDDEIAVAFDNAGAVQVYVFNGGDGASSPIVNQDNNDVVAVVVTRLALAWADDDTNTLWIAAEESAAEASKRYTTINTMVWDVGVSLGPGSVVAQDIRSVGLASRAFAIGEDVFACFVHDTTYFNVYLTLRLSDFVCVARQLSGSAAGAPTRTHLSSVHVDSSSVARLVLPAKERLESESNDKFGQIGVRYLQLNFDDRTSHQYAEIGAGLYVAGGCPQHYDGRVFTEQGFHVGPEAFQSATDVGGSLDSAGTYTYRAWYEHTDAQGEVHRGPTSFGTVVTMGGDDEVHLEIPTLRVTQKSNVRICVARSLNGDASRLFRVSSLDPTTEGDPANGYLSNDPTVDHVVFVDRFSDTTCRAQEPLYTNGGILSTDPSTPGNVVCVAKNRLFFNDTNDSNVIRYSQEIEPGYAVELPPDLFLRCDPKGGPITGLIAGDDGVVYVFKAKSIHGFTGFGPLRNGDAATSSFSDVEIVSEDVGCPFPDSLVKTPEGIMFDSSKGIYRLGLDRKPVYVGAPVETYNDQDFRAATVLPDRSQVLFVTDDGRSLLFDYLFQQWSTFTNHAGLGAVVVGGQYHYLRTDGTVWRETPGVYSDNGARIPLVLETAYVDFVGHRQGWQRFWNLHVLGTWVSAHQIGISYQSDFSPTWVGPFWYDATNDTDATGWLSGDNVNEVGIDPISGEPYGEGAYGSGPYGGVASDPYAWRLGLHCDGKAIRFRFEDFEKDGLAGASFELTEMVVSGGVMSPVERAVSAARSK